MRVFWAQYLRPVLYVNGQLFSALFHTLKHLITIQQNIDLSQRATFKNVDFWQKPLKLWFQVNVRPLRHSFHSNYSQMLISRNAQARQCWYQVICRQLKFWFHIITPPQGFWLHLIRERQQWKLSSFHATCKVNLKGRFQAHTIDFSQKANTAKTAPNFACQFVVLLTLFYF